MKCFLGLDIAAGKADFCLITVDINKIEQEGQLLASDFSSFLEGLKFSGVEVVAVACEYTGGIGGPWLLVAGELGFPAMVLHVSDRKAYQRLLQQFTKTDKADARTIARMLAIWHSDLSREFSMLPRHLFQEFDMVRPAWLLRELYGDVDRAVKSRRAALNRSIAATNAGQPERSRRWEVIANAFSDEEEEFMTLARDYAKSCYSRELYLLQTVPYIAEKCALMILGAVMPLSRFSEKALDKNGREFDKMSRKICRYVGFIPKYEASGGKVLRNERYHGGHRAFRSLLYAAVRSSMSESHKNPGALYCKSLIRRGVPNKKALYLTAKKVLMWSIGVLRTDREFDGVVIVEKPVFPAHLIVGPEAAVLSGVKRTTLVMRANAGKLNREVWGGRSYFLRSEIEALASGIQEVKKDG